MVTSPFLCLKGIIFLLGVLTLAACSSSSSGGGSSSSTYTLSGTLDPGASASSLSQSLMKKYDISELAFTQFAKTQCTDGKFYGVYCVSFSTPPVAAEGNVDCSNGGAFSVAGLPLNEPIGCFVRRYESASATTSTSVGAIEIPAANLNGSSDTLVSSGDVQLAVTVSASGTITASVQSGADNLGGGDTSAVDAAFTAANMNGVYKLSCDSSNGGSNFTPGLCKCFLGEDSYGAAGYANQDDCMNDSGGPGASITGSVDLGIGLYIYEALTNSSIPTENGQSIPSGANVKAISIWSTSGTPGSYVSNKTGGEGVTTLGGALTWTTTPLDPTAAVGWTTGSVTVQDGTSTNRSVTVPALPADPNVMDHTQWMTWIASLVSAAETAGFVCNWGPNDANAHSSQAGTNLANNIECANQVLESFNNDNVDATLPRLHVRPYCDQNGCLISDDGTNDSARPYYNANTMDFARIDFEGWHLDYPQAWANTDDYSTGGTDIGPASGLNAGIGMEPSSRHVFEPLIITPGGAGFRQRHDFENRYECVSGAAGTNQVSNAACTGGGFWELVCYMSEELAIKFIGTSAPMDVVFDQIEAPVSARLFRHNGGAPTEETPSGTDVLSMCSAAAGGGGGTFMATATKQ